MRRREFMAAGASATLAAFGVAAETKKTRRLGVFMGYAEDDLPTRQRVTVFIEQLATLGWREGDNLEVEYRWAAASPERMQEIAAELVAKRPDAILTNTTPVTRSVQMATKSIPIVFVVASDPVGDGFVQSLGHPGGNITGFINFEGAMGGKWLELLKELIPGLRRVSLMYNPKTAPGRDGSYFRPSFEAAAHDFGIEPVISLVEAPDEITRAMAQLGGSPGTGVIMAADSFLTVHRLVFMQGAVQNRIPALYPLRLFAVEGGLFSYGPDYLDMFRRAAPYVDRVLRGANVSELPVQVPSKFEMVVNLKAATEQGVTIAPGLLLRADEVIE